MGFYQYIYLYKVGGGLYFIGIYTRQKLHIIQKTHIIKKKKERKKERKKKRKKERKKKRKKEKKRPQFNGKTIVFQTVFVDSNSAGRKNKIKLV